MVSKVSDIRTPFEWPYSSNWCLIAFHNSTPICCELEYQMQSKQMRFNFVWLSNIWLSLIINLSAQGGNLQNTWQGGPTELHIANPNTWAWNFTPKKYLASKFSTPKIQDLVQKLENWNLNLSYLFLKDSSSRKSIPRNFQWPSYPIIWNKLCSRQCCSASDGNTILHAQVVIKIILNNIKCFWICVIK